MQEKVIRGTLIGSVIFAVLAILLMGWFQWNRVNFVRLDTLRTGMENAPEMMEEVVSADTASDFIQVFADQVNEDKMFEVNITDEINLEKCTILYDFPNHFIYLFIPELNESTLDKSIISADASVVKTEQITAHKKILEDIHGTEIRIPILGYYTCQMEQQERKIVLSLQELKPSSDMTIVLDAGHGGKDIGSTYGMIQEKDITLKIIEKVSEKLEKDENRVFCTRYDDIESSQEARVAFANALKANMLVSVHLELMDVEAENKKNGLTAVYNSKYFIPGFGSIDLANILEEETIQKMGGVANGLEATDEQTPLVNEAEVPVAMLEIDSTVEEKVLKNFESDSYIERIANGIYEGITRAEQDIQKEEEK